ncbi:STY0301 family protein [Nitrospirillum amazonense]|uniref:STY0301 family protein n=1 Tax=Nitrospirillum amazonense TaxID=28077 RepID=UPI0011A5D420|nr:STY0301 family protein [Nitrospirillum amazonense]
MKTLIILGPLMLPVGIASAAEVAPQCPKTFAVTETPASVPAGFAAYADGNPPVALSTQPLARPLAAVRFSEGPPTEQATLAPDATTKTSASWKFETTPDKNIWMSCAYLATDVIVVTKLPAAIKSCRVTLDKGGNLVESVSCR